MRISVIVPSYKPASYLWDCLDSLYNQTLDKGQYEVVLILNGCCEPYKGRIETWKETHRDMNLVFIQTDDKGVSNARNIGLDKAAGEYITFVDDDDYVSPSYLEELYAVSAPDTIGLSDIYTFRDGKPEERLDCGLSKMFGRLPSDGKTGFVRTWKFFSSPILKLISKEYIADRRFDGRFTIGEDSVFMFLISDKFKYVRAACAKAVYYRRLRESSVTAAKRSRSEIISNDLRAMKTYTGIFLNGGYNLLFYLNRIAAELKDMLRWN